jgi:hypothetical protein
MVTLILVIRSLSRMTRAWAGCPANWGLNRGCMTPGVKASGHEADPFILY